jgi:hypothetical protein
MFVDASSHQTLLWHPLAIVKDDQPLRRKHRRRGGKVSKIRG